MVFQPSVHSTHLSAYSYNCLDVGSTYFIASSSLATSTVCHGSDQSGGLIQLMDHDIDCGPNAMLSRLQFVVTDACCPNYCQKYSYTCSSYTGVTCRDVVNPATTIGSAATLNLLYLYSQDIACNADEGIGHIHYESYGTMGWYHYTCCIVTPSVVKSALTTSTTRYFNTDPGGIFPALTNYALDCSASQTVLNRIVFQPSVHSTHLSAYSFNCLDVGTIYLGTSSLTTNEVCYGGDTSAGLIQLTKHKLDCGKNGMLTKIQLGLRDACCPNYCIHYNYVCANYATQTCRTVINSATSIGTSQTDNLLFLYLQDIACLDYEGLSSLQYYVSGTTGYYNYTCCRLPSTTSQPTFSPTRFSIASTQQPTVKPSKDPTANPTPQTTTDPSARPSSAPSYSPTSWTSATPATKYSNAPLSQSPTATPTTPRTTTNPTVSFHPTYSPSAATGPSSSKTSTLSTAVIIVIISFSIVFGCCALIIACVYFRRSSTPVYNPTAEKPSPILQVFIGDS